MTFGSDMVWQAFLGLHRYCAQVGSAGVLAVPTALPKRLTVPTHKAAAERIATDLTTLWPNHPIECSESYFAYLYLFAQLLRTSTKLIPTVGQKGHWHNLSWMPLPSLAGRAVDGREAARAWFRKFHYEWVLKEYPHPNEQALKQYFPWVPEWGSDDFALATRHIALLGKVELETELPIEKILTSVDLDGRPVRGGKPQWHLWLFLSLRESWNAELPWTRLSSILDLLEEPEVIEQFHQFLLALKLSPVDYAYVLRHMDNLVTKLYKDKRLSLHQRRTWAGLRKRWRTNEMPASRL